MQVDNVAFIRERRCFQSGNPQEVVVIGEFIVLVGAHTVDDAKTA
jgi:hypothetical protein